MAQNGRRRTAKRVKPVKRGETPLDKNELDLYFNNAYTQTFNTVSRFVLSHASRFQDAEDIIQNVYARFYKRILEKGCEDIESVEAFLINIAKFECRSFLSGFIKRRERVKNLSDFSEEESAALEAELSRNEPLFDEVINNKILAKQIFDDIVQKDETVGRIFYLYFVCDMKLEEIAETMDMKLSTVKTKLYRTIERQKKKFDL
ncbi:MAG: RNA polymerase sigma factor [Lachnospiraceae bacterium]|nr:RNA polymerase sigma factor [Lachnospiraceae bacterium]